MDEHIHTPGPWDIEENDDGCISVIMGSAVVSPGEYACADSWASDADWDDPVAMANATLMAAAPDMLEALEMMMAAYEAVLPGIGSIVVKDYMLINDAPCAARAAIAKAKGNNNE